MALKYYLQTTCMAEKNGTNVLILHNELLIGSVAQWSQS